MDRIKQDDEEPRSFVEDELNDHMVETAVAADEELRENTEVNGFNFNNIIFKIFIVCITACGLKHLNLQQ